LLATAKMNEMKNEIQINKKGNFKKITSLNCLIRNKIKRIFFVSVTLSSIFVIYNKNKKRKENATGESSSADTEQAVLKSESNENDFQRKLVNTTPNYIETTNIENLISLPRYQNALVIIKYANKYPSEQNNQRVVEELIKLSDYTYSFKLLIDKNMSKLEEFVKIEKSSVKNPFLNDGLANYISQLLNDDLMIKLANNSRVDNRFFRTEPPSTISKLIKMRNQVAINASIFDDSDYFLLFEFYNNFAKKLIANKTKSKLYKDNQLTRLIEKFNKEMSQLIVNEHLTKDRPKLNVWSNDSDFELDELDDLNKNELDKEQKR
jgi:hypothetical protein